MQHMKGAPGVFPGQGPTHDLLNIPWKFLILRQRKNLCCYVTDDCKF